MDDVWSELERELKERSSNIKQSADRFQMEMEDRIERARTNAILDELKKSKRLFREESNHS